MWVEQGGARAHRVSGLQRRAALASRCCYSLLGTHMHYAHVAGAPATPLQPASPPSLACSPCLRSSPFATGDVEGVCRTVLAVLGACQSTALLHSMRTAAAVLLAGAREVPQGEEAVGDAAATLRRGWFTVSSAECMRSNSSSNSSSSGAGAEGASLTAQCAPSDASSCVPSAGPSPASVDGPASTDALPPARALPRCESAASRGSACSACSHLSGQCRRARPHSKRSKKARHAPRARRGACRARRG